MTPQRPNHKKSHGTRDTESALSAHHKHDLRVYSLSPSLSLSQSLSRCLSHSYSLSLAHTLPLTLPLNCSLIHSLTHWSHAAAHGELVPTFLVHHVVFGARDLCDESSGRKPALGGSSEGATGSADLEDPCTVRFYPRWSHGELSSKGVCVGLTARSAGGIGGGLGLV